MPTPNNFSRALASKDFILTAELDPPKGADVSVIQEKISALRDKVQGVVVSDNHSARMRMAPLGLCRALLDQGLEPILTLTGRDRNRLALQSDLLAAFSLGIQNVLAVTGDHTSWGDHPQAKPVYDLDSVQLLKTVSALNRGLDLSRNSFGGRLAPFYDGSGSSPDGQSPSTGDHEISQEGGPGRGFFYEPPLV